MKFDELVVTMSAEHLLMTIHTLSEGLRKNQFAEGYEMASMQEMLSTAMYENMRRNDDSIMDINGWSQWQ